MTVADLRQFLVSLAAPLESAGGKQAALDLRRAADGLVPFAGLSVVAFADFLARAQQYAETGVVPTTAKPSRRSAKVIDAGTTAAAAESYRKLAEASATGQVTDAQIDAEMKALDRLTKDAVLAVAKEVGIQKSLKTKKDALAELRRRVVERKETFERVRLGVEGGRTPEAS